MNEQQWQCEEKNLRQVLEPFYLQYWEGEEMSLDEVCDIYTKLFPPRNGYYLLSESTIQQIDRILMDRALFSLVDQGLVFMSVNEEGEFIFGLTEAGQAKAKEEFGEEYLG